MRGFWKNIAVIFSLLGIFALGAVGYSVFSIGMPDGLEKTMQDAGVIEHGAAYNAPLAYGGDLPMFLLMGTVGFFGVLIISLGVAKLMAKKDETQPDR